MAIDATGTPSSPDNIPTYNTGGDAPSGKGLNNIVAQIQALLTQLKAGTMASGKIAPAGITPGTNGQILTTTAGVSGWAAAPTTLAYTIGSMPVVFGGTGYVANTLTNLFSQSIPGGTIILGSRKLRVTTSGDMLANIGVADTVRIVISLGGVTLYDSNDTGGATNTATRREWALSFDIPAETDSGHVVLTNGLYRLSNVTGTPAVGIGAISNSDSRTATFGGATTAVAVDTTVAQTLLVQASLSGTGGATQEFKVHQAQIEVIG